MTARNFVAAAAAVASLGALAVGCGYKGPLTLPEKTGPVIIRPAAPATAPQAVPSTATPGDASPAGPEAAPVAPVPPAPDDEQLKKTAPGTSTSPGSAPATPPATEREGSPAGG